MPVRRVPYARLAARSIAERVKDAEIHTSLLGDSRWASSYAVMARSAREVGSAPLLASASWNSRSAGTSRPPRRAR